MALTLRQGAKKIIFTACHSGKLMLAFTGPDVISTSPQNFLTSRIDFIVLLLFEFLKKHHLPICKLETEFTSPIAKYTSPRLSDTTFFAHYLMPILNHTFSSAIIRSCLTPPSKSSSLSLSLSSPVK